MRFKFMLDTFAPILTQAVGKDRFLKSKLEINFISQSLMTPQLYTV